jgi:hypothetical protein
VAASSLGKWPLALTVNRTGFVGGSNS